MILQVDPRFPKAINKWGCFFISILYHAEKIIKREIGFEEIMAIYKSAIQTGIVGKEVYDKEGNLTDGCFINDPSALLHLAGVSNVYVGKVTADFILKPRQIEVQLWHNDRTGFEHFVVGNGQKTLGSLANKVQDMKTVEFDPIGKSITVKEGWLKNKRVFQV